MIRKSKLLGGVAAVALAFAPVLTPAPMLGVSAAQAQSASISFSLFFEQLQPHGIWVRHPQYRYVWCPTGVGSGWAPYTRGRWLYLADYGWYFASDEPFGWAVYHYGRWHNDGRLGWCWVPGTEWAPAWVAWRRGGDHVGWAPLPPEEDGFQVSLEVRIGEVPDNYWFFVPVRSFLEPDLRVRLVFGAREPQFVRETEYLGPVVIQNNVVINNVIEVNYIEQQTGEPVPVYETAQADDPAATTTVSDDTVQIFAPEVEEPTEEVAPPEAVEPEEAAEELEEQAQEPAEGEAGAVEETPADPAEVQDEAPAADGEPADAGDAKVDAEAGADAGGGADAEAEAGAGVETETDAEAGEAAEDPATGEELPCPPELTVDGACPPEAEDTEAAPAEAEPAPADAAEPAPADEAAPAEPEPLPESEPVQPEAPAEPAEAEPAPDATEAPEATEPEQTAPAEGQPLPCPPELMVDGRCPPVLPEGEAPAN